MEPLNHSFTFSGTKDSLEKFKELFITNYLNISDFEIDELDHLYDDKGNLIIFFDSYETPTKFVTKAKKESQKLNIDFNCTLLVGWDIEAEYTIYTYRSQTNKLNKYRLKSSHLDQVELDDSDGSYKFDGIKYSESDVPGVLFEDMIKHFFGKDILNFNES